MPTLHLHLREGFEREHVVVHAGDRVVFDEPDVRTRMQIGLATIREVEVPAGEVRVRIELPARHLAHALSVDAARTPYLGVSVDAQGALEVVPTADAFGYV